MLLSTLFANIAFKETRYMSAFDIDRTMYGNVDFKDQDMIINYTEPQKETISYLDDKVTIFKGVEVKEYSFEEYPQALFMGLIIKAIITENYTPIEEFFEIQKQKELILFIAKPAMTGTIIEMEVYKKNDLKQVVIKMSNQDKITIETLN